MKLLSLTQPYATAIALGLKTFETRSWRTNYRGDLAIHAAKGFPPWAKEFAEREYALGRLPEAVPLWAVVAVVQITDVCDAAEIGQFIGPLEHLYGDYSAGRYAWKLDNIRPLAEPVPCKGMRGLCAPPISVERAILDQLEVLK